MPTVQDGSRAGQGAGPAGRDKEYSKKKLTASVAGMCLDLSVMFFFAFSGISATLMEVISSMTAHEYIQFVLFMTVLGSVISIAGFPLDYYSGFFLEHRFGLSNQSMGQWLWEKVKSAAIGIAVGLPLSLAFFFLLRMTGPLWWLWFGLLAVAVTVLIARIAPAVIFPLFYKFRKIEDGEAADRIRRLLESQGVAFSGIFSFDMSRSTKKANAGFAGIGGGRRIILSDTLLAEFTPAEIVVIFAHELGHYRKHHLLKGLLVTSFSILLSFYLCGAAYGATLSAMGFTSLHEIAALPILLCYIIVFGLLIMPVTNSISRRYERQADQYALEVSGDPKSFISAMERLALLNLADRDPNPAVEFIFHGHPSITKRIARAAEFQFTP